MATECCEICGRWHDIVKQPCEAPAPEPPWFEQWVTRWHADLSQPAVDDIKERITQLEAALAEARKSDDVSAAMLRQSQSQLFAALARAETAERWSELVTRGKSPCGHWTAHTVTQDGGKHITCLDCDLEAARAALRGAFMAGHIAGYNQACAYREITQNSEHIPTRDEAYAAWQASLPKEPT